MLLFYAAISLSCGSVVTVVAMNAVATPAVSLSCGSVVTGVAMNAVATPAVAGTIISMLWL